MLLDELPIEVCVPPSVHGWSLNDTLLYIQLLLEVHLLALNESLPLVCRCIHAVLQSTNASYKAKYLFRQYSTTPYFVARPVSGFVNYALGFGLCSEDVLAAILRRFEKEEDWFEKKMLHKDSIMIPRRLFKNLSPRSDGSEYSEDDAPLPFLRRIFRVLSRRLFYLVPDVNESNGYALIQATRASHIPLIRFLLANGADPTCRFSFAMHIAIRKRDFNLLALLIRGDADDEPPTDVCPYRLNGDESKCVPCTKRKQTSDRMKVMPDLLKQAEEMDAEEIEEYLIDRGIL